MKTRIFSTVVGLSFLLLFINCSPKPTQVISDFTEKIVDLEKRFDKYTKQEWEQIASDFKAYSLYVDEHKEGMTPEERSNANQIIGRYHAVVMKKKSKELKSEIYDAGEKAKAMWDALNE